MIAALPMYDWPETRSQTDRQWAQIREALAGFGVTAPEQIDRSVPVPDVWLRPDLLIAQTCSQPLATILAGKVVYLASPTPDVPGGAPGHYSSAIVMRRDHPDEADLAAPDDGGAVLPTGLADGTMAYNETGSMSGYVAPLRDLAAAGCSWPHRGVSTGSHRQSVISVATGLADWAAIDCQSWALAQAHEPLACKLVVRGWTRRRPALPFITALDTPPATIDILRNVLAECLNAVVLDDPIEAGPVIPADAIRPAVRHP